MKKINFVSNYEKEKMPREKKFFYSVLVICVLTVAIASFISTYQKNEPVKPKSTTAKEVINNAKVEKDIPDVKIEKSKRFEIRPMDAEEAVMQMELLGHSFFVFRNGETEAVNIVYKRKDGTFGLIEPE